MITSVQQKISYGISHFLGKKPKTEERQEPVSATNPTESGAKQISDIKASAIKSKLVAENEYYWNFLYKDGKLTLEEYFDVAENHPSILTKAQNTLDKTFILSITPFDMAIIATKVDEYLKNNYDNCRIISVGTSPSPLCEALSLMGHDVIFLPFSNFSNYEEKNYNYEDLANLDIAMEYLKNKGLKKDDKTNIIIDFTSSGTTLNKLYTVIEERFPNIPKEQLIKMPIKSLMDKSLTGLSIFKRNKLYIYLSDMADSITEEISNVPHFNILPASNIDKRNEDFYVFSENKTNEEIFKEFEQFSRPIARAFALCTYNRIYKMQNSL